MSAEDSVPPYDPVAQSRAYVPLASDYVEGDHPTANPDGVTVSNVDYWPKTQEEKAAMLYVDMVEPVETAPQEPYPTGRPPGGDEREAMLKRIHTPSELVPGPDRAAMIERALHAGGAEAFDGTA